MTVLMTGGDRPPCTCVPCDSCNGTGNVWFDFSGNYLGNYRCDDMDQLERCDDCAGSGISEACEYCALAREIEDELQ